METRTLFTLLVAATLLPDCRAQVLIDSIPFPQQSSIWGIHVAQDTLFLGHDGNGDILFSDHDGNMLGQQSTGFDFNHGLVRKADSYLIAEDYSTNGASLYEVGLNGTLIDYWTFPEVIGGPSSGIGDLCADGDAIWYTMYYPDFDAFPYAYAYKWIPGDAAPIDTVPMHGEQPYGIALKGDTLFYVTDNLNGDQERIYAYDLTNEQDLGWIELPDTPIDNDQRPQGMFYDGEFLYLIANRQGGSAFAYQTVFIYAFDDPTFVTVDPQAAVLSVYPSPADERVIIDGTATGSILVLIDAFGSTALSTTAQGHQVVIRTDHLPSGSYVVRVQEGNGAPRTRRLIVRH